MPKVNQLLVNGARHPIDADADESLLNVLRERLGLTGSKYGCGEGRCGACTVIIDNRPVRSCTTLVGNCDGKEITTIEGLEREGNLHPLQQTFMDSCAMQCGFCTTGMIMTSVVLLRQNTSPKPDDIQKFMDGNICRCGTYPRIEQAIVQAAAQMKGGA